ncbi:hypothetical protein L198_01560 [Cryptococcus wingfieldii CBS 7118]|uniref:Uncharacterized protein n=1 Tax=Cryptococcus wingfieldii CBS 7118 TaxID=1295528 RepID=A0A1E3JZK7_9TREE|nr:hypothetical protein L198_01560 [Cryptococcus wingfieldii CBS 7118]ODO06328.1 hypothetical protein L198_01560 [Cryptococcus wingfieldii CBS 7118]
MLASLAIASLLSAAAANAVPCVQFDASWNLYAFGGDSDVRIGDNTTWSSPSTTTLTTSGRPPWTGNNTQCILSQTNNAMVVLGADSSDLSSVYIYDFSGDSWSTQTTSSAPSDLGNSRSSSVYDHDTSVIFTLTTGSGLYQLDLSSVTTSASSDAVAWEAVEDSSFSVDGYTVTAATAANHIFYFGVPDTAAGSANVFVVHYAYFQPDAQAFSGTAFPDTAGQAISIPSSSNDVPYSMVFIPNDFSNTYIATHWTNLGDYSSMDDVPFSTDLINSTQTLAAPTSQDETASYAASPGAIVQINAAGEIYYLSNPISSDYTVSSSASWSRLDYTLSGTGGTVSSSSNSSSSASASSSATGSAASGSSSASASASSSSSSSSGALQGIVSGNLASLALGAVALGAGLFM